MTAKEEVLETIRLWIACQWDQIPIWNTDTAFDSGYVGALNDLTELLDTL